MPWRESFPLCCCLEAINNSPVGGYKILLGVLYTLICISLWIASAVLLTTLGFKNLTAEIILYTTVGWTGIFIMLVLAFLGFAIFRCIWLCANYVAREITI